MNITKFSYDFYNAIDYYNYG